MAKMERYTRKDFERDFPDDDACLNWLFAVANPDPITCAGCGKVTKFYRVKRRKAFACGDCGDLLYPMAGTIYEKSRTPLKTWFLAVYLMSSTRTGVSAKWLERSVGVTYKTAWRMFRQIRSMLDEGEPAPLRGMVEIDETYIGGKKHGMGRGAVGKAVVLGMYERGGRVVAEVVQDTKRKSIEPVVLKRVAQGAAIFTDELNTYDSLPKRGMVHMRVNHKAKRWVTEGIAPELSRRSRETSCTVPPHTDS
ncbi:MAG TPA: IS1595 family transposase [Candidatus Limnocylindria bacterium]|nr:IS1595 family transposase [Candidatus Limnocylindria bacterium]